MRLRIWTGILTLGCVASAAAPYDLSGWKWRNIGPNRGGRSQAVAGSTARPLEYYFGATGGGLWKTTNGGVSWFPVTDGQIHSSSVGAVAVAPSNPDIVYIGMGETELRGNIMQGDGVYRSADGGKSWKHIGLADTQAISRILVHPSNPDVVYVAALGHPFGPNAERGIFRSTDGGANWKRVLFRDERSGAIELSMDPNNPRVLFAALWEVYRTPWHLSSGGAGSGLFRSEDGGETWKEVTRAEGLPKGVIGKIGVTVSRASPNRVYALIEASDGGLFRSDDSGGSWMRMSSDSRIRQRAFYFSKIFADPKDPDALYLLNVEFYRSTDGGKTLKPIRATHADHHDLWIAPDNPLRMINANDGGGTVSNDGGKTWTPQKYPTAQMYHVATTKDYPYHVCGAQQDNTTACVPSDRGSIFRDPLARAGDWLYAVAGGEAGYVTPDPTDANIFYGGSQAGMITRYDRRTGQVRAIDVYPLFFSGMPANALKDRWQWTFPIVFSPADPRVLYTSSQHLWKTANSGQSWARISPDLTRADPKTLGDSGGPITKDQNGPEIYGTIFTIAPARRDANTIWTGSDDGLVQLTRDGGKTWSNVTPPDLQPFSRISLIEASPHAPGGAYVAAKRYQMDDPQPLIYRTKDFGKTWTKIVSGINTADFVHAVREDPRRAGLLFAGTEHGIHVSFDDGGQWQSLSLNLPDTQVPNLIVEDEDVVIATHGRSFWILDNIAALRQLTPQSVMNPHLFSLAPAVRSVRDAVIDYYLPSGVERALVEILDAKGEVIRSFDSATKQAPVQDSGDDDEAPPTSPSVPGVKPGMNRIRWNLKYLGSTTFTGIVLRGAAPGVGPVAPPGRYSVRLTVNGTSQTQPLSIIKSPRLTTTRDADLQEQFRLAMQIRDRTSGVHEAVLQIRALRQKLDERKASIQDAQLAASIEDLKQTLGGIEEEMYQVRNRSPRDTLNYPIKLNNQLAVLQTLVDTGDNKPTDQQYAVFRELSAHADVLLSRLRSTIEVRLKVLNDALAARGMPAVQ